MGLSSSQVRFLSLQNRKNAVSNELSTLSNRKMSLAREMNRVSKSYNASMYKKVLKWSNDSGATYKDLSYKLLMSMNEFNTRKPYIITDAKTGKVVINSSTITDFDGNPYVDSSGNPVTYLDVAKMLSSYVTICSDPSELSTTYTSSNGYTVDSNNVVYKDSEKCTVVDGVTMGRAIEIGDYYIPESVLRDNNQHLLRDSVLEKLGLRVAQGSYMQNRGVDFLDALFKRIAECGWILDEETNSDVNKNHVEYLNSMFQNNAYMISETFDNDGLTTFNYTNQLSTNISKIFQVNDDRDTAQTLAEYETERALISAKEKKIDSRIVKLKTEEDALTTELESLQSIMNENIDKHFKIFA